MSHLTRRERKEARRTNSSLNNRPQVTTIPNSQHLERRSEFRAALFHGPLPPPETLAQYDQILPGAADRIIKMAEAQSAHRRELERAAVTGNIRSEGRGQLFAFILALATIVGGIGLIAYDKDTAGLVAIITAFTALAGVFIYGRYQQSQERKQKREEQERAAKEPLLPFGPNP